MNQNLWGPSNPHPLSKTKTELIWEGKYDEYGNRREIKLPSTPYPLQKIETIDEPHDRIKADRVVQDEIFDETKFHEGHHHDSFRNMLIWGDNKLILHSLLDKYRGKIDLVYIDPPFDVGADFTMEVQLGGEKDSVMKEQSLMEAVAYRDTWGKGTDSYLQMMYERLGLIRELLSDSGSIFVHTDWRVNSMIRLMLDEVMGNENFGNQIEWRRGRAVTHTTSNQFVRMHDSILYYHKTSSSIFERALKPYSDSTLKLYSNEDDKGRYRLQELRDYSKSNIEKFIEEGKIELRNGTKYLKQYLSDKEGVAIDDIWEDIGSVAYDFRNESVSYPTQKPEALISRIIKATTSEKSIVADFFCGSGTTLAVAEKLGRRWIGADLGRFSIHTTRKRMLQVQRELHLSGKPYRSFDVYNLGRYERQWWQKERLHGADTEHRATVMKFYKATELISPPSSLLHGKKGGALIHIDEIDGMFTGEELVNVAKAASMAGAKEVHILAWEFEMELTIRKQAIEAEYNVQIKLFYIPREIMESNRTECQFFEAGYLKANVLKGKDGKVDVALESFIPSLAEAPEKEISALRERSVKSPFDFIDFWAVDFDYRKDKPFEHHWQDFRIKKKRTLATKTDLGWKYHDSGKHEICVKVIDVFGVDTTIVIPVEV
jgi:DNA modification methylase